MFDLTDLYKRLKTSLYESVLNLGPIEDIFSKKRPHYDDPDDDDDDIQEEFIEPSIKRRRHHLNEEPVFSSVRTSTHRQFEPVTHFPSFHSSPFINITNIKTNLDYPERPIMSHYSYPPKEAKGEDNDDEDISPIFSSFKFSPSLTSTTARPKHGLGITKRKPIKDFDPVRMSPNLSLRAGIERRGPEIKRIGGSPIGSRKAILARKSFMDKFTGPVAGFKKFLTPKECFRLQDREMYKRLLQQFTSCDVGTKSSTSLWGTSKKPSQTSLLSSSGSFGLRKSHLDPLSTIRSRQKLEKEELFPTPSLSLSSAAKKLITSPCEKSSRSIPLIDLSADDVEEVPVAEEDEILITKEVPPPQELKNSLENHLQKSRFYSDKWLKDIREYYKEKQSGREADALSVEETKRRCESFRKENEKQLLDKVSQRISSLDISFPRRVTELPPEEEPLPEITPEMENVIQRALKGGPPGQVLADKFNIQITRRDLHTLQGLNWLNDEVINFYLNMIVERGQNDNFPSVYAFNTFFYSKLLKTGYASIKRWTKKVDIFAHDLLLVPVHLGMHWCLATIDFRAKAIRYYDSMLGDNHKCLAELKKYLQSEHMEKKKAPYEVSLAVENVKDIPQQMNGSDCGMFSCKFAEYLSRDAPITFDQENMPYFRRRMVYEIVAKHLL